MKQIAEMPSVRPVGVGPGEEAKKIGDKQSLRRLAVDAKDANALMALYENYEFEIRAAAIRWFGNNRGICEQAIHNTLVAIGRNVRTYDPQSMDAAEWVRRCADAEAKKLRQMVRAGLKRSRRPGRAR